MTKIAVLGAGITGITSAWALAERGFDVTVYDRQRYAGMETSFANGGQLSASNAEVWTQWGTAFKGLKWMMRRDAPLLVNPRPSWHKIGWMLEFLSNIPRARSHTVETVRMAIRARTHLLEMAAAAGVDFDYSPCGIMHFYTDRKDFDHGRWVTGLLAEGGLQRRELSAAEVAAKEPNLKTPVLGGFWTESDSTGDIHKFTAGLADAAEQRGVTFRYGADVDSLRAGADGVRVVAGGAEARFDKVVIAAGVGSRGLAAQVGDRINVYPVKGYSITVNLDDAASQAAAPTVSLLDDRAKIVTSRLGADRFRVAGTAEFNGSNKDIRADRIRPLTAWVERHFPGVSTEHVVPWAGLRPMMPSMMPRVGRGRHERVYYNTGHGHLGWTLSGATADMVAGIIAGDEPRRHVGAVPGRLLPAE